MTHLKLFSAKVFGFVLLTTSLSSFAIPMDNIDSRVDLHRDRSEAIGRGHSRENAPTSTCQIEAFHAATTALAASMVTDITVQSAARVVRGIGYTSWQVRATGYFHSNYVFGDYIVDLRDGTCAMTAVYRIQ
jgi:hypothetical protein